MQLRLLPNNLQGSSGVRKMSENNNSRSGAQKAVDLARAAKAAYRIAQAAAASGVYGAAVAAAKEALPFLIKIAIGIVVAAIVIPMVIFTALPNIFSAITPQIPIR